MIRRLFDSTGDKYGWTLCKEFTRTRPTFPRGPSTLYDTLLDASQADFVARPNNMYMELSFICGRCDNQNNALGAQEVYFCVRNVITKQTET